MHTFRYKKGHNAGRTMTIAELREVLSNYPDDMPVMAEWEGVLAYVEEYKVLPVHKGQEEDRRDCLVFDVEQY